MSVLTQETSGVKLNRMERIKKEKNPFEVWQDIERYALTGFESIDPDDLDRFKWYGIYTQRPQSDGYLMLRVKLPNGDATSKQWRVIAGHSRRFGQGLADITDRQNIQLHWLRIENMPTINRELEEVGLSIKGACGDTVRNVIGCPLAGVDHTEIIDGWPFADAINRALAGNPEFSDLPRKYKISVSGCVEQCAHPEINDLGLVGVIKNGEAGFEAWVGGGLGSQPHLAKRLGVFIRPDQVLDVSYYVTTIFRDFGYRKNRAHARLKFLVEDWGVEKFRQVLEERLGYRLEDAPADYQSPASSYRDHVGVYRQKDGRYAIGLATLRGRVNADQLFALADMADQYGSGRLRATTLQNVVLLDIAPEHVETVKREAATIGLPAETSNFRRGTIACTGIQFCKLAVAETKDRAAGIIESLDQELPGYPHQISINITGCPNSCTRYQTADIGLLGSLVRQDGNPKGEKEEVFQIYLGGKLGRDMQLGHHLKRRVPAEEAKEYIVRLLKRFDAERQNGETFTQFVNRHTLEELEALS
ncbi:MAG TPA: nitrite/sulfite reductase [Chloroflexia bacterium]|nr:nitrite/sulfite reductase [Chloroflexia bacterium]